MAKPVYVTAEGLEKLKTELIELKSQREIVAKRIKDAREFGDLSENAEYEDARNQQAFIEGRILELEEKTKNAHVVTDQSAGVASLASHVTVEIDGATETYTLVGPTEADPSNGKISIESPIGQALMSVKAGETVTADTPGGQLTIRVVSVN